MARTQEVIDAGGRILEPFEIWAPPIEGALDVLADYIGPHKILWATDYPHADGFPPRRPSADRRADGALREEPERDPGRCRDAVLRPGVRTPRAGR